MSTPPEEQTGIVAHPTPYTEYLLQAILKRGLKAIYSDTKIIDDLFIRLKEDEREEMKKYLVTHQKMEVRVGLPKRGSQLPMISIALGSDLEDETKDTLGFHIEEMISDLQDRGIEDVSGSAFRSTYQILIFTSDDRFTVHLYNLIKKILLLNMDALVANGNHQPSMQGAELQLKGDDWFPEFAYARVLTLSVVHYDVVYVSTPRLRRLKFILRVDAGGDRTLDEDTTVVIETET